MDKHKIYLLIRNLSDGLVNKDYRGKLLRWLANENDASDKDAALFHLWNETDGSVVSQSETLQSLSEVKSRLGIDEGKSKKQYSLLSGFMKYAAVFLLPLLTGISVWLYMDTKTIRSIDMVECFVPNGEHKKILLPDGTNVILNSGSLFIYPDKFDKDSRKVYLTGEAFFDVAHNEKQPFTVHTGRLNIEVLGTKFNVEAYSDDSEITTTLKQGKVKLSAALHPERGSILMNPNEQVIYNVKSGKMQLSAVNAEDYSSWTNGDLRFIERSLSEVMKVIGRKYDVSFRYDDNINLGELYTIAFREEETIEQVMRVMQSVIGNGMEYSIDEDSVYLYFNKKGGRIK